MSIFISLTRTQQVDERKSRSLNDLRKERRKGREREREAIVEESTRRSRASQSEFLRSMVHHGLRAGREIIYLYSLSVVFIEDDLFTRYEFA